jgi:adenosylhomocysteine nucleosidase
LSNFQQTVHQPIEDHQMDILVTFAVPEEARYFRRKKIPNVRILVTGMGATVAAEKFRAALDTGKPDLVLTCGFCGGLNPDHQGGRVIGNHDAAPDVAACFGDASVCSGRFHTSNRVATTAAEKSKLFSDTQCDAVEMESGAIRSVCDAESIPVAIVRVISDTAKEDLPLDFNKLMNSKGGIQFGRLALELAKHPRLIPKMMRLQKRTAAASKLLAEALETLLVRLKS